MSDRMAFYSAWIISFILFLFIPVGAVNPELGIYKNEFIQLGKNYCQEIKEPNQFILSFSKLGENEAGVCITYPFRKVVLIDEYYWKNANNDARKQLIFHELTHCILNKEHLDDPYNYMYPEVNGQTEQSLYEQTIVNMKDFCNEQR